MRKNNNRICVSNYICLRNIGVARNYVDPVISERYINVGSLTAFQDVLFEGAVLV